MRLVWATDVHLNFIDEAHARNIFCPAILQSAPDAILLGGDIAEAPSLEPWLWRLTALLAPLPIYFVLGNHDYYHSAISTVRAQMASLSEVDGLGWLPRTGPIPLTDGTMLVGHGGWGDGRHGDFLATPIRINDHVLIEELAGIERPMLLAKLHALGDEAAASLRRDIHTALSAGARALVILTHVPPFIEACWHDGATPALSSPWLPDFTCRAVGDMLLEEAAANPAVDLRVLCGHTHGAGTATIRDNLWVQTGGADYGSPGIAGIIDL